MKLEITKETVWAASIDDRPGGLAEKLEAIAQAGADLEFVIARRCPDSPGTGVVFVTPVKGAKVTKAAKSVGFAKAESLYALRIQAPDKPGLAAIVTRHLAKAHINLSGFSAAALGRRAVFNLAFDSPADAAKAARRLKQL